MKSACHNETKTSILDVNWRDALQYYSTLNLQVEADRIRFKSFVQDRCRALLLDYVDILDAYRRGNFEVDIHRWEMEKCNPSNCKLLRKRKRRKLSGTNSASSCKWSESCEESESKVSTEEDDDDVLDANTLFYRNLMDSMHCFVAHGYDLRFGTNKESKVIMEQNDEYRQCETTITSANSSTSDSAFDWLQYHEKMESQCSLMENGECLAVDRMFDFLGQYAEIASSKKSYMTRFKGFAIASFLELVSVYVHITTCHSTSDHVQRIRRLKFEEIELLQTRCWFLNCQHQFAHECGTEDSTEVSEIQCNEETAHHHSDHCKLVYEDQESCSFKLLDNLHCQMCHGYDIDTKIKVFAQGLNRDDPDLLSMMKSGWKYVSDLQVQGLLICFFAEELWRNEKRSKYSSETQQITGAEQTTSYLQCIGSDTDLESDSERETNSLSTPSMINGNNEINKIDAEYIPIEDAICTSTECVHLNWCKALEFYSTLNLKVEADRIRFRSFVQDRFEVLIRDYIHILDEHSGGDLEMDVHRSKMEKCNVSNCASVYRHRERRKMGGLNSVSVCKWNRIRDGDESTEGRVEDDGDVEMLLFRDLFDSLHYYVPPGYDIGFSIKVKPMGCTAQDHTDWILRDGNAPDTRYAFICRIVCGTNHLFSFCKYDGNKPKVAVDDLFECGADTRPRLLRYRGCTSKMEELPISPQTLNQMKMIYGFIRNTNCKCANAHHVVGVILRFTIQAIAFKGSPSICVWRSTSCVDFYSSGITINKRQLNVIVGRHFYPVSGAPRFALIVDIDGTKRVQFRMGTIQRSYVDKYDTRHGLGRETNKTFSSGISVANENKKLWTVSCNGPDSDEVHECEPVTKGTQIHFVFEDGEVQRKLIWPNGNHLDLGSEPWSFQDDAPIISWLGHCRFKIKYEFYDEPIAASTMDESATESDHKSQDTICIQLPPKSKKGRICKLHGSAKGCCHNPCLFLHTAPNLIPFCSFHLSGGCKKLNECTFRHVIWAKRGDEWVEDEQATAAFLAEARDQEQDVKNPVVDEQETAVFLAKTGGQQPEAGEPVIATLHPMLTLQVHRQRRTLHRIRALLIQNSIVQSNAFVNWSATLVSGATAYMMFWDQFTFSDGPINDDQSSLSEETWADYIWRSGQDLRNVMAMVYAMVTFADK